MSTTAEPSRLFDCEPMPKVIVPVTDEAPPSGTSGNSISTPLLSAAKFATGFVTCWVTASVVATQLPEVQL